MARTELTMNFQLPVHIQTAIRKKAAEYTDKRTSKVIIDLIDSYLDYLYTDDAPNFHLDEDSKAKIRESAQRKGQSEAEVFRTTVDKYLVDDPCTVPVLLRIPKNRLQTRQDLHEWLIIKEAGLAKILIKD